MDDVGEPGAWLADPLPDGADVVEGLQSIADRFRGERVAVPMRPDQLRALLEHLGRVAPPGAVTDRLRLEVGDDGWALQPWE